MPSLRCPECYYATTFRKDAVSDASCHNCGENLFKLYYEGKSQEESEAFIYEMGQTLKYKKDRAYREQRQEETTYTQPIYYTEEEPEKTSLIEWVIGFVVIFLVYATWQYFQMRSDVQETANEILRDNGYPKYEADGIMLPISAVLNGSASTKIFLKNQNGDIKITEWEFTSKSPPLLSIFIGSEYWLEISGIELLKLSQ